IWRSNWTTSAVWAQMNGGVTNWCTQAGGNCAGHQSRSAGNLEIQRGSDYFMPYAGQWKGPTGVTDSVSGPTAFVNSGWRANALYHDDGSGGYNFDSAYYKGGQGFWGLTGATKFQNGPDWAYESADLTQAYYTNGGGTNRSLTSYFRSVLMEGAGVIV